MKRTRTAAIAALGPAEFWIQGPRESAAPR